MDAPGSNGKGSDRRKSSLQGPHGHHFYGDLYYNFTNYNFKKPLNFKHNIEFYPLAIYS